MVVVADTSPINYFVLIGQIDLLEKLYSRILIPPAVLAELNHLLAPSPVRNWANSLCPNGWKCSVPKAFSISRASIRERARRRSRKRNPRRSVAESMSAPAGRKPSAEV